MKTPSVTVLVVWFTSVLSVVMDKGLTCWDTVFARFFSLEALLFFFVFTFLVFFLKLLALDTLGFTVKSDIVVGNTLSAVKGSTVTVLTLSCVLLD